MIDTRRVWIGTSWKMNKTLDEALAFARELGASQPDPGIQRFVIPSFTVLREVKSALARTDILVGAQNMHWADAGAWTGEVSPVMLKDCGMDLVEVGHSERRAHFGETDESVALKVEAAARHGLIPLICVGETAEERASGRTKSVLRTQVEIALSRIVEKCGAPLVLAYEPVWAIGARGTLASPDYADEQQAHILEIAERLLGRRPSCLYGGSVDATNCADLISRRHIDGLFIGRSAWSVGGYLDIVARCAADI